MEMNDFGRSRGAASRAGIVGAVACALVLVVCNPSVLAKPKYCVDLQKAFFDVEMGSGAGNDAKVAAQNKKATAYWNRLEKTMPKAIRKDWKTVSGWRALWTTNSVKMLAAWQKAGMSAGPPIVSEVKDSAIALELKALEAEQKKLAQDPKLLAAVTNIQAFAATSCA
jgi:hypothetical protein